MRSKVRLSTSFGDAAPAAAAVRLSVTPWGAEVATAVRFAPFHAVGPCTLRWPVNANTTVLDLVVVHARAIGATTIDRVGAQYELVTSDVVPEARGHDGITVVMVTAQPVSFKRLFMEWVPLGSPRAPCLTRVAIELVDLPAGMARTARVTVAADRDTEYTVPLAERREDGALVGEVPAVALAEPGTPRVMVRLGTRTAGFGVVGAVHVHDETGTVVLHAQPRLGGTPWYVKRKGNDPAGDNTIYALVTPGSPPPHSVEASNPDLLLAVAGAILEKSRRALHVAPDLSVTNLSELLREVRAAAPLCWQDDDSDAQHLARIARLLRLIPIPETGAGAAAEAYGGAESFEFGTDLLEIGPAVLDPVIAELEALPEMVQSVLGSIGIDLE